MANRSRGFKTSAPPGAERIFEGGVTPRAAFLAPLLLSSLLTASGCSSVGPTPGGSGHDQGNGGVVCPRCSVAGGETSDFGSHLPPTPCELSEDRVPIDETSARTLGFGDTLDSLTRSFTTSLRWTPVEILTPDAGPAQGFSSPTSITVATSVGSISHLVPTLAGCDDRVQVNLHTSLSTADGAIAISGDWPNKVVRGPKNTTFSRLDLKGARGSLELSPPDLPNLIGYLNVGMNFTSEDVRGFVYVELVEAGTVDYDVRAGYRPLDGQFPNDDCGSYQRVLSASDASATPNGQNTLSLDDDLNALLPSAERALWLDGRETNVTATLGIPTSLCQDSFGPLDYISIPLRLVSADGRLDIDGSADGRVEFDVAGTPRKASFERSGSSSPQTFVHDSGISGLDLSGYATVDWGVVLHPIDPDPHVVGGSVVVTGRRADNSISEIEALTWH